MDVPKTALWLHNAHIRPGSLKPRSVPSKLFSAGAVLRDQPREQRDVRDGEARRRPAVAGRGSRARSHRASGYVFKPYESGQGSKVSAQVMTRFPMQVLSDVLLWARHGDRHVIVNKLPQKRP